MESAIDETQPVTNAIMKYCNKSENKTAELHVASVKYWIHHYEKLWWSRNLRENEMLISGQTVHSVTKNNIIIVIIVTC
jgi:hypothetical protein